MDKEKLKKYIKMVSIIVGFGLLIYLIVIYPLTKFYSQESEMTAAAEKFFEINEELLPTGARVAEVDLSTLYNEKYLPEDLTVPYTNNACSIENSWVKVKKEDGEYKYYTYLECGILTSLVDHDGPEIKLNGDDEIEINLGTEYKDEGIKSVIDNSDGEIKVNEVVTSGEVDTSKIGKYEIKYTVSDSLSNETVKIRKVNVVQKLNETISQQIKETEKISSYVYFSGQLFQVINIENDNILMATASDVSYVNYSGIDEWLEYYYDNLNSDSKKKIIDRKYCVDAVSSDLSSAKCSETKTEKVGILSVEEYQKYAEKVDLIFPSLVSWVRDEVSNDVAWTTSNYYFDRTDSFKEYDKTSNLGIRPTILIDGNQLISSGIGSYENPYMIDDIEVGSKNDQINTRTVGEYITYSSYDWRIAEIDENGSVKIIMDSLVVGDDSEEYVVDNAKDIYNPEEKGNIGYIAENKLAEFITMKNLKEYTVEVPIYDELPKYNNETSVEKYKVNLSIPNIYDMFSTPGEGYINNMYWVINSSKNRTNLVATNGYMWDIPVDEYLQAGFKLVAYLDESYKITSGQGTRAEPYKIVK